MSQRLFFTVTMNMAAQNLEEAATIASEFVSSEWRCPYLFLEWGNSGYEVWITFRARYSIYCKRSDIRNLVHRASGFYYIELGLK
jgi:hypothetical protein